MVSQEKASSHDVAKNPDGSDGSDDDGSDEEDSEDSDIKSEDDSEEEEKPFTFPKLNPNFSRNIPSSSSNGSRDRKEPAREAPASKRPRRNDLDPMDPASYSDIPRGKWSDGLKEARDK